MGSADSYRSASRQVLTAEMQQEEFEETHDNEEILACIEDGEDIGNEAQGIMIQ